MILAVDIGNTNISVGSFSDKKLISHFRIDNKVLINQKATTLPIKPSLLNESKNIIIASVNPDIESVFYKSLAEIHIKKILKIGREIELKIPILVENPQTVGIDRVLNALAAYRNTGTSTIVIDFGTAITIDVVSQKGEFMGGLILPGIRTSAYALNKQTALLPEVNIKRPAKIIGKNVEDAIKGGIYFGTVGSIIHIVKELNRSYGYLEYTIATGGDAKTFKKDIPEIDKFIPYLTLEGIKLAFEENLKNLNS
ncbi:transcriptional regulator [Candidatus Scalindua japonica]|uniref:Type III pantothenate kinase n=1 Tax=Candidatus Scalindua japonica TaxID=1284222 RepID=A0A286U1Q6_9BACT|nr:type III pantothenate kinase [Candidatus Scalindua japonica]GAX62056.1 transcriptional regulator [Candidatus Scalindua japonica]